MTDDLRKYMPRMSTIMRETDPRKMEERHRQALQDPALQAAIAERAEEAPPTPRMIAPSPWARPIAGEIDEAALPSAMMPAPGASAAAEEERLVTKPVVARAEHRVRGQRRKKMLVSVAAVLAVAAPTTLGIVMASRLAGRGAAVSASASAAVTGSASAAPSVSVMASAVPDATGSAVVVPHATASTEPVVRTSPTGKRRSPGEDPHDAPALHPPGLSAVPTVSAAALPAVSVAPTATAAAAVPPTPDPDDVVFSRPKPRSP